MPRKRLIKKQKATRVSPRFQRYTTVILLSLLSLVSALTLSTQTVSGIQAPTVPPSPLTTQANNPSQLAIQARQLYEAGRYAEAAEVWEQAAVAYKRLDDKNGRTQSQVEMAEAFQALGFYPRACNTLLQAFEIKDLNCSDLIQSGYNQQQQNILIQTLTTRSNSSTKAIGLRSLGDVLQKLNQLEISQQVLQMSLNTAKALRLPELESAALLSLGNTYQAWGNSARARLDIVSSQKSTPWQCLQQPSLGAPRQFYQQAASFYQQAATTSTSEATRLAAQINHLNALLQSNALSEAQNLWQPLQIKLQQLPTSRTTVYGGLNLASSLNCLKQTTTARVPSDPEITQTLALAVKQARELGDKRAESYALGNLGGLYAQAQQWSDAQTLTEQALTLAQAIEAADIAYKWQWQLGYILKTQGNRTKAIAAYTQATETLQSLRSELTAASREFQFSFQQTVEPVYRQLVDLLLQPVLVSQENLSTARDLIESLQIAELENLLRCRLTTTETVTIDQLRDPTTAVLYPIVLDDRIEIILSLYKQPLRHYSSPLAAEQNLEDFVSTLRESFLASKSAGPNFLKLSQQMYNWLMLPVEKDLADAGVETLVFVPDGVLRNIPMSALYDGQHYLVERYAPVLSPSIRLLQPKPVAEKGMQVLAAGISQKIPGFNAPALPEVKEELETISVETDGVILRNQEFTRAALETKLNKYPFSVVHLATHGQFSSAPEQTYIRAWDQRIDINQLRTLLQSRESSLPNPVELLVLSACDTAQGDKRAVLGLAGVAVRAGARSTLATLWQVNDDSTAELIAKFYQAYNSTDSIVTKAKALQKAQLELLREYKAPYYWASYVLVGNWL